MTRLALTLAALAIPAPAVPDGFVIQEFAGPPNADYPAAITVAPNGDVYVSSDQNGSLGKDEGMGRIIRCRDTDGDGKADDFVHFVPDVDSPRGGHIVGDTLYLIHPPFLSTFRDTDGDGVADEKKQLVKGFGGGIEHPRGADHTTNGVRMGIDGWLYVSVGDFGMADAVGTDGTRYTLHGGGIVRVRPDGSEMEPYALMTRNTCDVAISPELDMFSRDNTNDGKGWNTRFHHYTALGDHGYPRLYQNFADEAIAPLADYGGGSGTGGLWVSEPGFPGGFGDMLFSCDWTTGNIYYHPHEKVGASFKIGQEVFEKLPRATDIDVDGFSRLYLADWRGGQYKFAGKGKPVGMIHLVKPTGGTPARYQDVTRASDEELPALLASASAVQRLETQQEILRRGAKPLFAEKIFALAKDAGQSRHVRACSIFTFKQLYGKDSTRHLAELVGDAAVREFALRAMTDRLTQLEGVPVKPYLDALTDKDARVVLQGLVGLQRLDAADATAAILSASTGWKDEGVSPRLRHTAIATLSSLGNVPALLAAVEIADQRGLALRALQRIHSDRSVAGLVQLVETTSDDELRLDALIALARLHFREQPWDLKSWWGTRPDDRGPYFAPVTWEASDTIRATLERGFGLLSKDQHPAYLDAIARNRIPVSELKFEGMDPVLTALAMTRPGGQQLKILVEAAKDPERTASQRVLCYQALTRAGEKEAMPLRLAVLAGWSEDESAPAEAGQLTEDFINETQRGMEVKPLRQIAAKGDDTTSRIAWKALLTVMNSPLAKDRWKSEVRKHVDQNPLEVGFFLAIADLKLPDFDQQIDAGLNWDNQATIDAAQLAKAAAAGAAKAGRKVVELPPAEVLATVMEAKGDVAKGKRIYTAQGCIACHAVDAAAEQKGPYLGSAGSKFTRDYLIESVIDPNKVVAQGFRTTLLTLKDGSAKLGFVTGEADGVIEIRDITGAASKVSRKDVTREEELPQSMMPPGLAANLTIDEFTSLIDYLSSLRAAGQ
ncbi:c-type cytochrome [Verrucomicrobiaceae bacterium E54]|nr:c-type cytochrome [Verrucomicrobiaceae bacterium E54]